jgi:hypothetical protein
MLNDINFNEGQQENSSSNSDEVETLFSKSRNPVHYEAATFEKITNNDNSTSDTTEITPESQPTQPRILDLDNYFEFEHYEEFIDQEDSLHCSSFIDYNYKS